MAMAAPLSPGSEVREKARVTLLLDINTELLFEALRLQEVQRTEKQAEKKDDATANTNFPDNTVDKDKAEKETAKKEYFEWVPKINTFQ